MGYTYSYRKINILTHERSYTNRKKDEDTNRNEIQYDVSVNLLDADESPIYDNDVIKTENGDELFVIKQAEDLIVGLGDDGIIILDDKLAGKARITGTIYELTAEEVKDKYKNNATRLHESEGLSINVHPSHITFNSVYSSPIVPKLYLEDIKDANILFLPNNFCFTKTDNVIFPEVTRDFFTYMKNVGEDKKFKVDIIVDDSNFKIQELHSDLIILPSMLVDKILMPILPSIIANYLCELAKRYNKTPKDSNVKLDVIVSESNNKKSTEIHYNGPADQIDKIIDYLNNKQ